VHYLPHPLTQLTYHPSAIQIHLAVFPQFTRQTDTRTHTDRPTADPGNKTCTNTRLCSVNDSDAANNVETALSDRSMPYVAPSGRKRTDVDDDLFISGHSQSTTTCAPFTTARTAVTGRQHARRTSGEKKSIELKDMPRRRSAGRPRRKAD